ncbi:hypothetical protein [Pseudooctadecabacter sp.]|uniref:hypothetical protein n=1 Tax=Pseudooctadecabacter sp. TaxID=1966338 RepID=UPI0035C811C4
MLQTVWRCVARRVGKRRTVAADGPFMQDQGAITAFILRKILFKPAFATFAVAHRFALSHWLYAALVWYDE